MIGVTTTITTELLIKAVNEGADLPPRPILITFDDGHLNNYTTAFPIMKKYGFTGVLYIVANYMGADQYMNAGFNQGNGICRLGSRQPPWLITWT